MVPNTWTAGEIYDSNRWWISNDDRRKICPPQMGKEMYTVLTIAILKEVSASLYFLLPYFRNPSLCAVAESVASFPEGRKWNKIIITADNRRMNEVRAWKFETHFLTFKIRDTKSWFCSRILKNYIPASAFRAKLFWRTVHISMVSRAWIKSR